MYMLTYVKLFEQFIFENSGPHSYGCAMLYFKFPEMKEIQSKIAKEDIYEDPKDPSYGLEKNPHCTLLYGLWKKVKPEEVSEVVKSFEIGECTIHKVSKFESDDYDVLKFEVKNPVLHKINKKLTEFPHTNKFKDYKPHATIAYLKKGMADKYIKMFKGEEFKITPHKLVYSKANGENKNFYLK